MFSGCGSARLERLVRDQEVGGSNPLTPTMLDIETLTKIAKALEVGVDDLIK